jgi:Cytochrome c554 and c-prime
MARALQIAADDAVFLSHKELSFRQGNYSYTLERRDSKILYTVTDGIESMSLPLQYVFGVGSQTFVLQREGRFYESLVSYYPAIDGLDITVGDQQIRPKTLLEAMGRELRADEYTACFGCHSTGAVEGGLLKLDSLTPGVQCEHCHVGADDHLAAISEGKLRSVPPKLSRLSPEDLSNFCGQCHRAWETVVRNHWTGEMNVRFQPYRLANSKCFDGSDPRLRCTACHDPHQEIVRDDETYSSKCLACHSERAKPSRGMLDEHPKYVTGMKSCPVSKDKCVSCHMPRVQLPGAHLTFTDHQIRVVHSNEAYPN